jgi:hypothetical protein
MQEAALPMKSSEINSCDKAAEAIFRSSQPVQVMLRAPGAQYKIEYRPGDPDNPNNRYWFWIYGSPTPGGPTNTYDRFQLDAKSGQLYHYDAVRGQSSPVPSDVNLKKYLQKYCGK